MHRVHAATERIVGKAEHGQLAFRQGALRDARRARRAERPMSRKGLIYLAGVFVLGVFYETLKGLPLNRVVLFAGIVCYLFLVRLLAERLDRQK